MPEGGADPLISSVPSIASSKGATKKPPKVVIADPREFQSVDTLAELKARTATKVNTGIARELTDAELKSAPSYRHPTPPTPPTDRVVLVSCSGR